MLAISASPVYCQSVPVFGNEIPVTIQGLFFDAMEPAISADGDQLFFNSLNDGITTSLYYATRVNDSVFTFTGPLAGANQSVTPRLDAVGSIDSAGKFYWTTTRDFPAQQDNLMRGEFDGADVVNTGRVRGDFYNYGAGWIMMDAAISYQGDQLWFTNAYFGTNFNECGGIPCQAKLALANRHNDTIFNKHPLSEGILQSVNDTGYVVYAPHVSADGKELYFTRYPRNNPSAGTEICVAVRAAASGDFGPPQTIHPASQLVPEAVTLTTGKNILYYHKRQGSTFSIFMRRRMANTGFAADKHDRPLIYPNPVQNKCSIDLSSRKESWRVELYSPEGLLLLTTTNSRTIDLTHYPDQVYHLKIIQGQNAWNLKLVKQRQR